MKFNDPITKYVPELAAAAKHEQNAVDSVDWESVTVGNLASQMSGAGRDCESGFSILCFSSILPFNLNDGIFFENSRSDFI